ncbi:splicing factor U2af large subunit B [Vigna unguiculata]|uniref:Splicing factor U2AF a subunit n=1 Tax=Vigna unguiculata TaxID=3917 RepID=A0A4D6MWS0_VIGUN|nr:splicing factor U2af large subunit B [Vigna unguiculata]QCE05072.1 splicing factor U2AF a subunit [Vigna unguiculata]
MSKSNRSKDKHGKSDRLSGDNCDEGSAARTRPFSFEEIMLRRRNKELLENVEDPALGCSLEKIDDHFESARTYKHDKSSSFGREKHASEEYVKVSSRKKVQNTYVKEDDLIEVKGTANHNLETKSSAGLNNKGRITKEKTEKETFGHRKNEQIHDSSEYKAGKKHSRDRDSYVEANRPKSERKKKKNHVGEDENPNEYVIEKRHDNDRDNSWRLKRWLSNNSEEVPEKKHYRESDKDKHAGGRAKYARETKRKYQNGDDETQDRSTPRKHDAVKHHNMHSYERKERRAKVKSHYEELTAKRRRSRSREREDRRSPSFPQREQKRTYQDGERKESSMHSLKDSSRKKHPDMDKSRVSTNGSSSHHHRHGGSTSGLGGYSPRKRKSEAAVKTPSPSKHSLEKKRAGWDLPPVGTNNPSPAVVSSSFLLSNCAVLPNMHGVVSTNSLDLALVKRGPVPFLNDVSTGKNSNIDSVQLTQATRPIRRLYLENLPASASEKAVMDCFNNLLLSGRVNHIQQAQPCISCVLHKDRGQALVEFLTAEDASSALSFDGSTLFGSIVKIRRPKDYVEIATGEPERSMDATVTISDVVIDSPHKIFIGGISNLLSSEMLMEIASAFGSLKAYHFETNASNASCAFLEYSDHSVSIKACAGMNGMKLGGEVLTVVQAMPDASSPLENAGELSYGIPEHAKPLLRKPTSVLEIKNVFAAESISSLSDLTIEEILDDVRFECARFGTIKSINVVRHSSEKNLATKLEEYEVINEVESKDFQDTNSISTKSSFSDKATDPKSEATNWVKFDDDKELEEYKVDGGTSVNTDKNAEVFEDKSCREHLVNDTVVEDVGGKSIPSSIIQEFPDQQDTSDDVPKLDDEMVANDTYVDIENKIVGENTDSKGTVSAVQEGFSERDTRSELVGPQKVTDTEDDNDHVFEPGSVLVEYRRAEACCSAAHSLHGRLFDGRMVTVEYVSQSLYRARFTK